MGLGSSNRARSDALMSRPPTEEFVLQHRLAQLRRLEPVGRSADLSFDPPMMRGLYPPQPVEIYAIPVASKSTAHENRTFLC